MSSIKSFITQKKIAFYIAITFFHSALLCSTSTDRELYCGERPSSEPYLSGDTFRKYCDWTFDIKTDYLDPEKIKKGDIIFIGTGQSINCLDDFFLKYFPKIASQIILVTHNGDMNITVKYKKYLDSNKIFAWFAQNAAFSHPKLIPIPIGLENQLWKSNYAETINDLREKQSDQAEKQYLLYLNFSIQTNTAERKPAYDYFRFQSFCYCSPKKTIPDYLFDVCRSVFIVSPHGNGLDCHRTWEALYLGAIPVVKTSILDRLYDDLPVVIVSNWREITQEFLEKKYNEMKNKNYKLEKLYISYWKNVFKTFKQMCINQER